MQKYISLKRSFSDLFKHMTLNSLCVKGARAQIYISFSCVPRIFVYKQLLDMRVGVALEACVRFPRVPAELLVPWTENHLSGFKCGFLNIFSRQNLLRSLSSLLFLLQWNKNGAKNV